MSDTSREQTLGSGESAGGSGHFDFPQPSDEDPLRAAISMSNSPQSRSPMFRTFSRSSSGYFSVDSDSVPGSPLMPNITEAQDGQNDEVWLDEHSHQQPQMAAPVGAMRPEMVIAQELRRIGDEFNRLYFQRAGPGGNDEHPRNDHVIIIWMNDLIGHLIQFFLRRR